MKHAYLVAGLRTPFAKAGTELRSVHAAELGRFALSELLSRSGLSRAEWAGKIDEAIFGNTGTPSDTANISRVIALRAGLPQSIPAHTVHRNCASGMEAVAQAALKVRSGEADVVIAGGTESMSQMPLMYDKESVAFFEALSKAKTFGQKASVLKTLPLKHLLSPRIAIMEGLTDPFCSLNMGQTAEILAKEFRVSRQEQDQFALESHLRAGRAQDRGTFNEEVAPFMLAPTYESVLSLDSGPRKNQSLEALAKLKPYFDKKFGTVTVGNACPITDGAAVTIIANEEGLAKLGMKPLARIRNYGFAGLEPERMGLGPVFASHKVLEQAGLTLSQMGVVEINEAFAAQVLACLRAMDSDEFCKTRLGRSSKMGRVDPQVLNPNGGAIAIGHPVGTTGTRLVLTTALEMKRRNAEFGLATLCIGGGQGGSVVLESVKG
jgi:acetyl-CoA acyltransferase